MASAEVDMEGNPEIRSGVTSTVEAGSRLVWSHGIGPTPFGPGRDSDAIAVDWSGRGVLDLLVTSVGGESAGQRVTRLHRPAGSTSHGLPVFDEGEELPTLANLRLIRPVLNGRATRFDLFAVSDNALVYLRNRGKALAPRFDLVESIEIQNGDELGSGRIVSLTGLDWDGDGRVDLLLGFEFLRNYWPAGDSIPTAQQIGADAQGGSLSYNSEGRWQGQLPEGQLIWLRNLGGATSGLPRFEWRGPVEFDGQTIPFAANPSGLMLAWGGSRAAEFLTTDASGRIQVRRNFGGQLPPVLMDSRTLKHNGAAFTLPIDFTTLTAADLNDDRRPELLHGSADGRVFAIRSGSMRDDVTAPTPILWHGQTVRLGGGSVVTAADLDADGGIDLVAGNPRGSLFWAMDLGSEGTHAYGNPEPVESGGEPFLFSPSVDGGLEGPKDPPLGQTAPLMVDWKGNGRVDLLVGTSTGEVLYLRNNGHATQPRFDFAERLRIEGRRLVIGPNVRPAAADWYAESQMDLIGLDAQGFLCVYPRAGTLEVDLPVHLTDRGGRLLRLDGGFGLAGRCALWAGHWTGSDRPDLLVGLPRSSRFVVPALTGLPCHDDKALPNVLLLEHAADGTLIPRPIFLADGEPLIIGQSGCSPCGVDWSGSGQLDLLVGSDSGEVFIFPRESLRW